MTSSKPLWNPNNNAETAAQFRNPNNLMPGINRPPSLPPKPNSIGQNLYNNNSNINPYSTMCSYYPNINRANLYYNNNNNYGIPTATNSMYSSPFQSFDQYGQYGNNNNYGMFGNYYQNNLNPSNDHERRFIQYAEESSRETFASVENIIRAFHSVTQMLDNTFFAMTSSFRAILSVAEHFGSLRSMFGQIWYTVNIFRFISWLHRKFRQMLGLKVPAISDTALAWKEAAGNAGIKKIGASSTSTSGSSWPTLAFLGVVISAPYIISKCLPKYEDKLNPNNWKSPGINAKVCFDFIASSPNELTINTNDDILLAPEYLQEELKLRKSGWAYAVHNNNRAGLIPLNYIVICKNPALVSSSMKEVSRNNNKEQKIPVPQLLVSNIKEPNHQSSSLSSATKTHSKKVSFGNIEIYDDNDKQENSVRKEKIPSVESS